LKDIHEIQVVKDSSLSSLINDTAPPIESDMVISIRLIADTKSDIKEPVIIGTVMDNIESIAEKLRFAVNNAKNDKVKYKKKCSFIFLIPHIDHKVYI
jgi:hypothetical protein